jgi:hypothetical protein
VDPIIAWPISSSRFEPVSIDVKVEHRRITVVVIQPWIDKEVVMSHGKVVTTFYVPDCRRGIVSMIVAPNLASESFRDYSGAACAVPR